MADFQWPWQYKFPPFFSIQPNLETRTKQLEAWCSLVLTYQRHTKQYSIDVTEVQNSPLFYNKAINRKLSLDAIYTVLDELRKRGNVEWQDKFKKQCLVTWRTPDEWGKMIYSWVCANGLNNTVCTFYELTEGENTSNQEFHGIDKWLLVRALKTLEAANKAAVMDEGVKFF